MPKLRLAIVALSLVVVPYGVTIAQPQDMPGRPGMPRQGMGMHGHQDTMAGQQGAPAAPQSVNPAAGAFAAVVTKMHADMTIDYTANPDVDFARSMIPHHQGAIDMAKVMLEYGKDPELRRVAQSVIEAQESEITLLKAWLARQPR